ncbi:MAG: lysophospholipase [Lachnospiraceae bacterium]|nr:lysophospholipase [Lachnospiraceae bacterium]
MKQDFTFPSSDGRTTIHAVRYVSENNEKPKAVLQISHGMVEYIERYSDFAEYIAEHGFVVFGHDHAGHGESVVSKDDLGYFGKEPSRILISDMHTLRCMASEEYPEIPYFMLGHSMGSFLLREYLSVYETGMIKNDIREEGFTGAFDIADRKDDMDMNGGNGDRSDPDARSSAAGEEDISGISEDEDAQAGGPRSLSGAILMGTGFSAPGLVSFVQFLIGCVSLFRGERYRSPFIQKLTFDKSYEGYDMTGEVPERSWLTKDVEIVKKYYSDPKCNYLFTANGYKGLMEAVKSACSKEDADKISEELPILLVSGAEDPVGARGDGVRRSEALYKEAGIKNLTCRLFDNDRHEIINETDRDQVYEEILFWMQNHLKPRSEEPYLEDEKTEV